MISRRPIPHRHLIPRNLQAHPFACIIPAAVCLRSGKSVSPLLQVREVPECRTAPIRGHRKGFCPLLLSIYTDIAPAAQYAVGRKNVRRETRGRDETRPMWSTGREGGTGRWVAATRGEGRHAIVDAECTIVDEVHVHARREAFLRSM